MTFAGLGGDIALALAGKDGLGAKVDCVISFDGRLPLELGRKSLGFRERAALEVLGARADLIQGSPAATSGALCLGMRAYGRLILEASPSLGEGDSIFGWLPLDEMETLRLAEAESRGQRRFIERSQEADAFLHSLPAQGLADALEAVESMLDHIDPVLVYVEDALYTLFSRHNNLIESRGSGGPRFLFSELRRLPLRDWPLTDRVFLACMRWLGQAGLRGEEFNGLQLGVDSLHAFFDGRLEALARALGSPEAAGAAFGAGLGAKAALAAELKSRAKKEHHVVRWVNGLTFYKEERLLPRQELPPSIPGLDQELESFLERGAGPSAEAWSGGAPLAGALGRWVRLALKGGCLSRDPERLHPIEDLIHFLVEQAVALCEADIGMSRSLRGYGRLIEALRAGDPLAVVNWPTTDYFCCVAPSPSLRRAMLQAPPGTLATVLNAISQRMNYNSWHYMPGHFPGMELPQGRHYYNPPGMADTAEWSNLHHSGHVLAKVLYSIRAPGSLRALGRDFAGFFDLRLMRQSGRPFGRGELKLAMGLNAYLGAAYQALMDALGEGGGFFSVRAFDKAWYQGAYA